MTIMNFYLNCCIHFLNRVCLPVSSQKLLILLEDSRSMEEHTRKKEEKSKFSLKIFILGGVCWGWGNGGYNLLFIASVFSCIFNVYHSMGKFSRPLMHWWHFSYFSPCKLFSCGLSICMSVHLSVQLLHFAPYGVSNKHYLLPFLVFPRNRLWHFRQIIS